MVDHSRHGRPQNSTAKLEYYGLRYTDQQQYVYVNNQSSEKLLLK